MTFQRFAFVWLCAAACASDKSHTGVTQSTPPGSGSAPTKGDGAAAGDERSGSMTAKLPPATAAFRTYAATKLGIPESQVDGGPSNEQEASWFDQRVGSLWAMTMFPHGKPQSDIRGWASKDGTVVTVDQNLGLLLAEAGVWGGGVTPALTPVQIAERIAWSLGMNHLLFMESTLGVPPPEVKLTGGAGTMAFVINYTPPGPGRAPRQLTRFDIALTKDHHATATRTAMPAR
jgi:hypothetical protein